MRCALKSCELFKILHLSLPDNMIGEKEMNDIAYVLQRNTPLKTLNLSENVVDSKAAKILAKALGHNSHLRDLDLRNNKLGDAGIAVLCEPFILQKLMKFRKVDSKPSKKSKDEEVIPPEENGKQKMLMSVTKKNLEAAVANMSTRKLKMKIERLLINNNEQTEEALKHIYTALLANPDIEIRIDLPSEPVLFTNESLTEEQDEELEEEDESPTPNHAAVA